MQSTSFDWLALLRLAGVGLAAVAVYMARRSSNKRVLSFAPAAGGMTTMNAAAAAAPAETPAAGSFRVKTVFTPVHAAGDAEGEGSVVAFNPYARA